MKHRFVIGEFGSYCFRCGIFKHAIESHDCKATFFPNVPESLMEEAENWVIQPHDEERNVLAVRAYVAGWRSKADQT